MRGAECVDYCGRNEGVGMSGAGQRWAARSLSRAKSSRNWARWLCPWRYGRGKRHTGIRWAWSVTLHITVQHDPLITDEQDELLDLFRLNQRCLVVHFGSATAQRVGRAYAPGGAREVFFARGQAGFNAETQRNAEKRGEEALCEPLRTLPGLGRRPPRCFDLPDWKIKGQVAPCKGNGTVFRHGRCLNPWPRFKVPIWNLKHSATSRPPKLSGRSASNRVPHATIFVAP